MHEDLKRGNKVPEGPKDRSFGLVFFGFFTLVSIMLWWKGSNHWPWTLGVAAVFLVLALTFPRVLAPLNKVWMKFGLLLHNIVNPLVMGLLFFLTITPIALFFRTSGKDQLNLKRDPDARSYWIDREPPGPDPKTMPNVY